LLHHIPPTTLCHCTNITTFHSLPYVNAQTSPANTSFVDIPTNHQTTNLTPIISKDTKSKDKLQFLEERLRAIEEIDHYGFDAAYLCLIPNVVIPHKFKILDFDKYKGNTYQKNYLTMYCRKIVSCAHDDKLLVHFF
ncbi:hypothetical protein CR513_40834, partial [Mucuna pruriens]